MLLFVATALAVSPQKVVTTTLREIRQARPDCAITPGDDALAFQLSCGDRPPIVLYLDRLVAVCAASKAECRDYRANMVQGLSSQEMDAPLSLDHIVPAMRLRAYVTQAEAAFSAQGQATTLLTTPYGDTLTLLWMFDLPATMRPLLPDDLVTLGVDRPALEAAAHDNCARLFKVTDRMDEGDFHMIAGAEYAACALLLDPDAIAGGGAPVTWASMPTGGVIIFSTSTAPDARAALSQLSTRIAGVSSPGDRPLDGTTLRRTATGWEVVAE